MRAAGKKNNLATTLKRRTRSDPMRAYDTLPVDLRQWLALAALPWSAASAWRVWRRVIVSEKGDPQAARRALDAVERRRLERDVVRIWGKAHPFLDQEQEDRHG